MAAPVRAKSDTLRVTTGIPAAIACDAISRSMSAIICPARSSSAFRRPHTTAVASSGFMIRSINSVSIRFLKAIRRDRCVASIALAMPYSISANTMVDNVQFARLAARKAITLGSGLGRASSLQTFVSISTKNLAISGMILPRRQFKSCAACNRNQVMNPVVARQIANLRGIGCRRRISLFEQNSQFGFQRTPIFRRGQSSAFLNGIIDVADRNATHRPSPMIALQSTYSMRAL